MKIRPKLLMLLLADQIDKGVNVPDEMQRSARHLRPGPDAAAGSRHRPGARRPQ